MGEVKIGYFVITQDGEIKKYIHTDADNLTLKDIIKNKLKTSLFNMELGHLIETDKENRYSKVCILYPNKGKINTIASSLTRVDDNGIEPDGIIGDALIMAYPVYLSIKSNCCNPDMFPAGLSGFSLNDEYELAYQTLLDIKSNMK